MELRCGNAGANTVEDHLRVRPPVWSKSPAPRMPSCSSVSTAPGPRSLLEHLEALNTKQRTVR
jgi:hypothetical protein